MILGWVVRRDKLVGFDDGVREFSAQIHVHHPLFLLLLVRLATVIYLYKYTRPRRACQHPDSGVRCQRSRRGKIHFWIDTSSQ
jgi:hypothetical protein